MEKGSSEQRVLIQNCLKDEAAAQQSLTDVIQIVRDSGALDYTRALAQEQSKLALDCLDNVAPSEYRDALVTMVNFAVNRSS